jgi:hypothetical protein
MNQPRTPLLTSVQGTLALSCVEAIPNRAPVPPPSSNGGAELDRFAERFAHVLVEVMAGNRGPQQLARWSSEQVYQQLLHRCAAISRVGPASSRRRALPVQLRRVRVFCPQPDVAEISIVAKHGHRFRAIAARIEHTGKRWSCTAIQFG